MKYKVENKFSFSGNEERTNKLINSLRVGVTLHHYRKPRRYDGFK